MSISQRRTWRGQQIIDLISYRIHAAIMHYQNVGDLPMEILRPAIVVELVSGRIRLLPVGLIQCD